MSIKEKLHAYCLEIVAEKHQQAQEALKHLQQSHEAEGKSSMGDKYETGREMINLEKGKVAQQLNEVSKMKQVLDQIDPERSMTSGQLGSLIETTAARYFLAISVGRLSLEKVDYFIVSPSSPIGQVLLGKAVGDHFDFGGKSQRIKSIS